MHRDFILLFSEEMKPANQNGTYNYAVTHNKNFDTARMIRLFKKRRNKDSHNTFGDLKNDSFDFEQIEKYFGKKIHYDSFQLLSDKTCNDLDFQELFMFIDRTESRVGQQFLYDKLRSIPLRKEDCFKNEWLIQKLSEDIDFRLFVQKQLTKLNNQDAYYITSIFQEDHLKRIRLHNHV